MEQMEFQKLYEQYQKDVYYVALRIVKDDEIAKDIVQDTFAKAYTEIDKLQDVSKFKGWVTTIGNNMALNYLKRSHIIQFVSTDENDNIEFVDEHKGPEEETVDKDVADILMKIINKLPDEQRISIFMYYYEDMSVSDIAASCGCSEKTIYSRLSYAKKNMRKEIDNIEDKGVKLRCTAALPFLYVIFMADAKEVFASSLDIPKSFDVSKAAVSQTAKKTVTAGFFAGKRLPIVIAGVATAVVVAGVAVFSIAGKDDKDRHDDKKEKATATSTVVADGDISQNEDTSENDDAQQNEDVQKLEGEIKDTEYDATVKYINESGLGNGTFAVFIPTSERTREEDSILMTYDVTGCSAKEFISHDSPNNFYGLYADGSGQRLGILMEHPTSRGHVVNIHDENFGCDKDLDVPFNFEVRKSDTFGSTYDLESIKASYSSDSTKEVYQEGNYYVIANTNYENIIWYEAYCYPDDYNEIKINFQFDDSQINKVMVKDFLDRFSFQVVGEESLPDVAGKSFAEDEIVDILKNTYEIYLKDYNGIDSFKEDEIVYMTNDNEYELCAHSYDEVDEDWKLIGEYSHYNVYYDDGFFFKDKDGDLGFSVDMKTDIDDIFEQYDQMRQDILK